MDPSAYGAFQQRMGNGPHRGMLPQSPNLGSAYGQTGPNVRPHQQPSFSVSFIQFKNINNTMSKLSFRIE